MICAWKELLALLPQWMRQDVDKHGQKTMQELRLRVNAPPELIIGPYSVWLDRCASSEDLAFIVNTASRYSPWAAETVAQGYITAQGGHRIGICGEVVCHQCKVTAMRYVDSLCIRVARDFPGISKGIPDSGSLLILGAPGWGKSTLLRDFVRSLAQNKTVAVVDERGELFPGGIPRGRRMDVLSGSSRQEGIDRVLRTMGPEYIAVDEITAKQDCEALLRAHGCGVGLIATAHASSMEDYRKREVYKPLRESGVFDTVVLLNRDRQWHVERNWV